MRDAVLTQYFQPGVTINRNQLNSIFYSIFFNILRWIHSLYNHEYKSTIKIFQIWATLFWIYFFNQARQKFNILIAGFTRNSSTCTNRPLKYRNRNGINSIFYSLFTLDIQFEYESNIKIFQTWATLFWHNIFNQAWQ